MKLTKERKIILSIGIILLLIGIAYRYSAYLPSLENSDEEIALKTRRLAKYRYLISEKERISDNNKKLERERANIQKILLNGETESLAAVDIQNILNEISKRSGASFDNIKNMKSEQEKDSYFTIIPLKFSAKGSIGHLTDAIYQIENSEKLLKIREARIYLPNQNKLDILNGEFTVIGYMQTRREDAL